MTSYIVFEGSEGVFKTTQVALFAEYLRSKGKTVLVTKEPGTNLSPLTMILRDIVLNNKYEPEMTLMAREFIIQAIRSIHVNNIINPAIGKYDYIVQDRGIMSSIAYGIACGVEEAWLEKLNIYSANLFGTRSMYNHFYDITVFLKGDVVKGHHRATSSKQEFVEGDAMESKGLDFQRKVEANFNILKERFSGIVNINVEDKTKEAILNEIILGINDMGYNI
jgi:dTMP kinase